MSLTLDQTITFPTRTGGRVVVRAVLATLSSQIPSVAYESECEVCHDSTPGPQLILADVFKQAREHAAMCTALPADYVDCAAASRTLAAKAAELLKRARTTHALAGRSPSELIAEADAHTRLAAVYADLAHNQP